MELVSLIRERVIIQTTSSEAPYQINLLSWSLKTEFYLLLIVFIAIYFLLLISIVIAYIYSFHKIWITFIISEYNLDNHQITLVQDVSYVDGAFLVLNLDAIKVQRTSWFGRSWRTPLWGFSYIATETFNLVSSLIAQPHKKYFVHPK